MQPAAELAQSLVDECVGNAHGNLERVRELVEEHPALARTRASWGESPVDAATQMGRRDIIEYLVSRGAAVDHALILASSRNPREFIQRRGRVLRRCEGRGSEKIGASPSVLTES